MGETLVSSEDAEPQLGPENCPDELPVSDATGMAIAELLEKANALRAEANNIESICNGLIIEYSQAKGLDINNYSYDSARRLLVRKVS